ncbi:MAG: hypothetical protein KF905_06705 [Flavobacteriales bacterium]|nr:hypothetical protein [Flavobacteriales bacterium]
MRYRAPLIPLLATLMLGCGGGETANEAKPSLVIGEDAVGMDANSIYQMPTPNELFSLVRDMVGEGNKRMLNPASNATGYASLRSRAVNFGVYATDLVFVSYFKMKVEVARYYLTSKKMADALGLTNTFTDADFVRLEANLTRGDSLEIISNAAYMRAYEKLQEEEMGPVLSMVLAGGWVESMHLVIRQIENFGSSEAMMQRVAEQKVTLEHLISMMEMHATDKDVAILRDRLIAVRDVYDRATVQRAAPQSRSTSGRMMLGDDVRIELTPELYLELVQVVDALRADMILPENTPNASNPS